MILIKSKKYTTLTSYKFVFKVFADNEIDGIKNYLDTTDDVEEVTRL